MHSCTVELGQIFDLTNFLAPQYKEKTYELIALITHIGRSGNTGHYISYCNTNFTDGAKFNDSKLLTVSLHIKSINSIYKN